MADELAMPILLHPPAEPVGSGSVGDFRIVEQVGRFLDVTMCIATLAFSGRLQQYPGLRFIGATAGGAIGLLGGRLDSAYAPRHYDGGGPPGSGGPPGAAPVAGLPAVAPGGPHPAVGLLAACNLAARADLPAGGVHADRPIRQPDHLAPPSEYLRNVYVDTANLSAANQLANIATSGAEYMLFGTDSPPLATPLEECIAQVVGSCRSTTPTRS